MGVNGDAVITAGFGANSNLIGAAHKITSEPAKTSCVENKDGMSPPMAPETDGHEIRIARRAASSEGWFGCLQGAGRPPPDPQGVCERQMAYKPGSVHVTRT